MKLHAEETKVVTIEGKTLVVESLPAEAQQLVAFYDDWKQKELEFRSDMMMAQTAMKGLANQIAAVVMQAEEEKAGAGVDAANEAEGDA